MLITDFELSGDNYNVLFVVTEPPVAQDVFEYLQHYLKEMNLPPVGLDAGRVVLSNPPAWADYAHMDALKHALNHAEAAARSAQRQRENARNKFLNQFRNAAGMTEKI